ncbi:MAG TPA: hypothetical protein VFQ35_15955 [Polyangiaceae bacterium]|nr:hypothetical protein [Polyangiaceae bacterium]
MHYRSRRGPSSFAASRLALRRFLAALFAFVCIALSHRAEAYPWMIRHGYTNCSGCHADPSGGELLTVYGHAISYEALSTKWGGSSSEARAYEQRVARAISRAAHAKAANKKDEDADDEADADEPEGKAKGDGSDKAKGEGDADEGEAEEGAAEEEGASSEASSTEAPSSSGGDDNPFEGMSGITGPLFGLMKPSDTLLLGGAVRVATIHKFDAGTTRVFPMQLDLYGQLRLGSLRFGGSVGAAKVPAGSLLARPAQVTSNQGDGYNVISRTHWVGFDFGNGMHTIRAGRLNLPFGLRMSEHTMWVRDKTQTNRESQQQHGVALFMGFDKVRFEIMGIAGNLQANPDKFRERGYSGYVEFVVGDRATLGVNSLYTESKADPIYNEDLTTDRGAHGLFARAALGKALVVMGEADVLTRSRRELGYVGFLQLDAEVISGLHLLASGEVLDAGYPKNGGPSRVARIAGQGKTGLGGWFGAQWFFLPHFDFRVDAIVRQDTQLLGQLHIYL